MIERTTQMVESENRNPDAMVGAQAVKRQQEKLAKAGEWAVYRKLLATIVDRAHAAASKMMPPADENEGMHFHTYMPCH
jgi:hypothetical protein